MMTFTALMQTLDLKDVPDSWEINYAAAGAEDLLPPPSQAELQEYGRVYGLPSLQLEQLCQGAKRIRSDAALLSLWHLWYAVLYIADDCRDEQYMPWPVPPAMEEAFPGIFRALIILAHTKPMLDKIQVKALPDQVLTSAVSNFVHATKTHYDRTGFYGLSSQSMWWLWPFMHCRLYRLGRLQYEISKFNENFTVYHNLQGQSIALCSDEEQRYDEHGLESDTGLYHPSLTEGADYLEGYGFNREGYFVPEKIRLDKSLCKTALESGDDVLSLHIPGEGKLTMESVLQSFEEALPFFRRFFPEMIFKAFVCHTWLFNTGLKAFLPPHSNILAFQSLFSIQLKETDTQCLFDFVFHAQPCPLDQLVPENEFQEKLLHYVRSGGVLRGGFGYRLV